jgi:hypothetical protein
MIRKTATIAATAALTAALALWFKSYHAPTGYNLIYTTLEIPGGYRWAWHLRRGMFEAEYHWHMPADSVAWRDREYVSFLGLSVARRGGPGGKRKISIHGFVHVPPEYRIRGMAVAVPSWMPAVILAPYPILAFVRGPARRWRRRRRGLCVRCGYDLEGNVSGVCPECGTTIEVRTSKTVGGRDKA